MKLMNETLQTIFQRRSIRQFADRPLSDELIRTVLAAANQAPSAHNQQSWKFIVVRGEEKLQLGRLVSLKAGIFPKPSASILRMAARSITSAPTVIAVVNTGTLIEHGTELFRIDAGLSADFFRTMEIQSSAAAVQNLLLAATSLGLASVWLGILFLIKNEVLTFLGQQAGEFMAVIPLGYPLRTNDGPRKRALEYVVEGL
ncbi:MAG: nitroreductase family protein [Deltaproteobacteria bacterium]|nr:nitroreductase family protein [Deltaproteobacteria bacterium]